VFKAHNNAYVTLGTFLLWVSWFFFNGGSSYGMFVKRMSAPPKIIVNTALGGAIGGITAFLSPIINWDFSRLNRFEIGTICNGILAGLVAVTASCDIIDPWAAIVIGIIGSLCYMFFVKLLRKLKIDDPVQASCVHFAAGIWGMIATAFFHIDRGVFYGAPDVAKLLGV
jgi:ammonium transporter, Amt family